MSKEAWFAQKAYGTEQHFLTPQNKTWCIHDVWQSIIPSEQGNMEKEQNTGG